MRATGVAREVLHADRELPRTDSQRNKTMTRLLEPSRSLTGGILWEANLLTGTRDIKRLSMGKYAERGPGGNAVWHEADGTALVPVRRGEPTASQSADFQIPVCRCRITRGIPETRAWPSWRACRRYRQTWYLAV